MAHEIAKTVTGQDAMAYVGDEPWHGLGQKLEAGASIDEWLKASGLDYELKTTIVQNGPIHVPGKRIIYRDDTKDGLAIVSDRYKVVQPNQVLEFFRRYAGGMAQIETAGVLFGGRRYWALAKLEGEINVAGDITRPYLMMASSCDGTLPTQARLTSVRVVCNNTLEMSQRGAADISIRHTSHVDLDAMHSKLEGTRESLRLHAESLKKLAKTKMDSAKATEFLLKLTNSSELNRNSKRILELFEGAGIGADLESSKGTAYGLLQATTQFVDWEAGRNQDGRLQNAWLGAMSQFKVKAHELLFEVA
jgi:phage/plasmid-like protein (TIGR03299 family)